MKNKIIVFFLLFIISDLSAQDFDSYFFNKSKIKNNDDYDNCLVSDPEMYEAYYGDFYRKKDVKSVNAFLLKRYRNISDATTQSMNSTTSFGYDFVNNIKLADNDYISSIVCIVSAQHDNLQIMFWCKSNQAKVIGNAKKFYISNGKKKINFDKNSYGDVTFIVNKENLKEYLDVFSGNSVKYFFGKQNIELSDEQQFFINQYILLFSVIDDIDKNKFTESEYSAIKEYKIFIGMSEEALIVSWGFPKKINTSNYGDGPENQFCYDNRYVYTKNGVVTGWN